MAIESVAEGPLMEPQELARVRHILRKEATGWASDAERQELYDIVDSHTGKARSLPWHALLEVAQWAVRMQAADEDESAQSA